MVTATELPVGPGGADAAPSPTRCGIVAVVGRASVGKSTLLNRLVGEKVSIVSPIPQTTRNIVRAVHSEERGQLVFLDTPGLHKARSDLGRLMNRMARGSIQGADVILLLLDASGAPHDEDAGWMRRLVSAPQPVVIGLNKVDVGRAGLERLQALWEETRAQQADAAGPRACFELSGATGAGVAALMDHLFTVVPLGPRLFPEEMLSDFPRRLAIADVVREKLFAALRDEVPHAIAVHVTEFRETPDLWAIDAEIYVQKPTQKGIVIGRKGALLKRVREQAVAELTAIHEREIRLELWVKVQPDWQQNFWILRKLGYQ